MLQVGFGLGLFACAARPTTAATAPSTPISIHLIYRPSAGGILRPATAFAAGPIKEKVRPKPDPTVDSRRIQAGDAGTAGVQCGSLDQVCIRRVASAGSAFRRTLWQLTNCDLLQLDPHGRSLTVDRHLLDLLDNVHPLNHPAERRVLPVEDRRARKDDEER